MPTITQTRQIYIFQKLRNPRPFIPNPNSIMAPTIKVGDTIPSGTFTVSSRFIRPSEFLLITRVITFQYIPYSPELEDGLACGIRK